MWEAGALGRWDVMSGGFKRRIWGVLVVRGGVDRCLDGVTLTGFFSGLF